MSGRRPQKKCSIVDHVPKGISKRLIRQKRKMLEAEVFQAFFDGFLWNDSIFLGYEKDQLPEIAFAAKLYAEEKPQDTVRILGIDPEDGLFTIQVRPDRNWLDQIKAQTPPELMSKLFPTEQRKS